jgi:hypothetical protein
MHVKSAKYEEKLAALLAKLESSNKSVIRGLGNVGGVRQH